MHSAFQQNKDQVDSCLQSKVIKKTPNPPNPLNGGRPWTSSQFSTTEDIVALQTIYVQKGQTSSYPTQKTAS